MHNGPAMLEMHTTEEFAGWFDALEDGPAEDVATALEMAMAAGLALGDLPVHSLALRELTVCSPASSRWRILYGVDLRRNVALTVLGEPLDRSFYGDSVRRAELLWQQFYDATPRRTTLRLAETRE